MREPAPWAKLRVIAAIVLAFVAIAASAMEFHAIDHLRATMVNYETDSSRY